MLTIIQYFDDLTQFLNRLEDGKFKLYFQHHFKQLVSAYNLETFFWWLRTKLQTEQERESSPVGHESGIKVVGLLQLQKLHSDLIVDIYQPKLKKLITIYSEQFNWITSPTGWNVFTTSVTYRFLTFGPKTTRESCSVMSKYLNDRDTPSVATYKQQYRQQLYYEPEHTCEINCLYSWVV